MGPLSSILSYCLDILFNICIYNTVTAAVTNDLSVQRLIHSATFTITGHCLYYIYCNILLIPKHTVHAVYGYFANFPCCNGSVAVLHINYYC